MLFILFCSAYILEDTPLTSFCASTHASTLRELFNTFPSFSILSSSLFTVITETEFSIDNRSSKRLIEDSK